MVEKIDGTGTTTFLLEAQRPARILSKNEAVALARALPEWLLEIVLVSAETRLPRKQVLSLLKAQVDMEHGSISLPLHTKDKEVHHIKLATRAMDLLRSILKKAPAESPYLFSDTLGTPYVPARVSVAFRRSCQAVGLGDDVNLGDLGRDFANQTYRAGRSKPGQAGDGEKGSEMPSVRGQNHSIQIRSTTILRQSKKKELQHAP